MFSVLAHALRSWKSARSVAILAIAALAAGIGSATAIYAVVDAVLLRPLPYRNGDRFAALFSAHQNESGVSSTSWLDLLEYQRRTHSFDAFGIFEPMEVNLTAPGEPRHLKAVEVTPGFTAALGVQPTLGRWFGEAAGEQGNVQLAVISTALWKALGADPQIIGRPLTLDGRVYTVTGVMPAWFRLPLAYVDGGEYRTDVWLPLNPEGERRKRDFAGFFSYVRLAPGITFTEADADAKRVAAQLAGEFPLEHRAYTARVINLREVLVREIRPTLMLLFGAAGALLLITCANVAGLLLARSVARARETAIRVAIGASRRQLALQFLVEGLLVAVAGAAAGLAVSFALVQLVLSLGSDFIPRADGIGVNWPAVLFSVATAVFCSLLFSLAPLWQALHAMPQEALGGGVRSSAPARTRRLSRSLVIAEIAMAFAMLSVSALLLAHLQRLKSTAPGFTPAGLLCFSLNVDATQYRDATQLSGYQRRIIESIETLPGVTSAAIVNHVPMAGCCYITSLYPDGIPADPNDSHEINIIIVSPRYLSTMRIPLIKGRDFDARDAGSGDILPILIDSAATSRFWHGKEALGSFARVGGPNGSRAQVIGIAGNVRNRGLVEDTEAEVYLPFTYVRVNPMTFMVRSVLPASTLVPQLRQAVHRVDPSQPLYRIEAMSDVILGSLSTERLQSLITGFFSLAALFMALLGIYGVVSYSVRHRTVEIGTRLALGAVGRDVLTMILGDGLQMALTGIVIGAGGAIAAALLLRSQVFGVRVDSPLPFLYSGAIVAALTAVACVFPGWRAALVSPMVAIRDDPGSLWLSARTVARRITGILHSSSDSDDEMPEAALTGVLADSSREAESFREAMQRALSGVREALSCQRAVLLQTVSAGEYRGVASAPDDNGAPIILPGGGLIARRLRSYGRPLPLSSADLDAWERWAAAEKPAHLPEIEALRATGAALMVPLQSRNEMPGILLLGAPTGRSTFSGSEIRALRSCAGQFALMIENARLTSRLLEQEKLNRDVQLATEVQKRLFPDKPPATAAVSLAGMSLPARSVGGDYYDFLDLGNGRIGIALADVAGKGVAAALIMSVVQASLRILATQELTLAELAERLNRFLHRSTGSNAYATFFYGLIDEPTRSLRYVNAGHNPPCLLHCRADHTIEELPAGGTVIGLFPQSTYEERAVALQAGDILMAFTDGLPEALNPEEEEYGEERLKNLLRRSAALPVQEMAEKIAAELKSWIDTAPQYDDLTFILVKVHPQV